MRLIISVFSLAVLVNFGCKKASPPNTTEASTAATGVPAPPQSETAKLLRQLAKTKRADQLATADQLADLAERDPAVIPGLLESLKDKTNLGEGQVLPGVPNSVREAAVMALLRCGPAGEKALLEQGLPMLLTGLGDPSATVREHTLYAIARLGPKGKSAIPQLWPLAEDSTAFVRDAAYSTLRELGVQSALQVLSLLSHSVPAVRLTAAEQLSAFRPWPAESVGPLRKALADPDKFIRNAAAENLLDFGAKAAEAAPDLAAAIRQNAKDTPPNQRDSLDFGILNLLISIGASSVEPVGALLTDKDPLVVFQALYVLGELGPVAKPTSEAVERMMYRNGDETAVRLEAARALAQITGDGAKSLPLLKLALTHQEPQVRSLGLQVAGRMGVFGRALAEQVYPLLDDSEPALRKLAISFVGTLDAAGKTAAVPRLAKRLKDEAASVRVAAANALADFGPSGAAAAGELAAAAADDDADVRQTALTALADLGPAGIAGQKPLLAILADSQASSELKAAALAALLAIAPAAPESSTALLQALSDASVALRERAAKVAPRLKAASPAIIARLAVLATSDANASVRTRATEALAEIEPRPMNAKDSLANLTKSPIPELAQWAKIALSRIDNRPEELAAVVRAGMVGTYGERLAGLEALGRLVPAAEGDFAGVDKLSRAKDAKTRQQAAEALGRFASVPARAVPRLVEMLQDRDEDVQFAAIQSLAQFPARESAAAVRSVRWKAHGEGRIPRAARRALTKWEPAG